MVGKDTGQLTHLIMTERHSHDTEIVTGRGDTCSCDPRIRQNAAVELQWRQIGVAGLPEHR